MDRGSGILLSGEGAGGRVRRGGDSRQELCLLWNVAAILCQREPLWVFKERNDMMKSMIWEDSSGSHIHNGSRPVSDNFQTSKGYTQLL